MVFPGALLLHEDSQSLAHACLATGTCHDSQVAWSEREGGIFKGQLLGQGAHTALRTSFAQDRMVCLVSKSVPN